MQNRKTIKLKSNWIRYGFTRYCPLLQKRRQTRFESIRNKNFALQVILQCFYLVLGIFYYDFLKSYFPEQLLVSAADG